LSLWSFPVAARRGRGHDKLLTLHATVRPGIFCPAGHFRMRQSLFLLKRIWRGAIISRESAALHAGPVQIMPRPGASAHALRVTWTN
jgi:hypothetical protein